MTKRKATALILALALCLGLMPVAFAAEVRPAPSVRDKQYGAAVKSHLYESSSDDLTGWSASIMTTKSTWMAMRTARSVQTRP